MRGTPWNLPPRTATGSSYSAPATATSSSTAATATAPARYSRWTTRIDKAELARSGAELIGEPESDGTWTWRHLPGARPNIHSLGARMA